MNGFCILWPGRFIYWNHWIELWSWMNYVSNSKDWLIAPLKIWNLSRQTIARDLMRKKILQTIVRWTHPRVSCIPASCDRPQCWAGGCPPWSPSPPSASPGPRPCPPCRHWQARPPGTQSSHPAHPDKAMRSDENDSLTMEMDLFWNWLSANFKLTIRFLWNNKDISMEYWQYWGQIPSPNSHFKTLIIIHHPFHACPYWLNFTSRHIMTIHATYLDSVPPVLSLLDVSWSRRYHEQQLEGVITASSRGETPGHIPLNIHQWWTALIIRQVYKPCWGCGNCQIIHRRHLLIQA